MPHNTKKENLFINAEAIDCMVNLRGQLILAKEYSEEYWCGADYKVSNS